MTFLDNIYATGERVAFHEQHHGFVVGRRGLHAVNEVGYAVKSNVNRSCMTLSVCLKIFQRKRRLQNYR